MSEQKTLLTGVKPSGGGRLHIGNYFGAIKPLVDLQAEYETYIFLADYHALTSVHNGEELSANTLDVAIDYLALGVDPERVTLYKQSDVPEHTELAWIFDCITAMSYLERGHAYKDAREKGRDVNVGTFTYPMLMAADILMYDADVVPVGQDQKQHIEFARDTAEKFNRLFGETFKLPDGLIKEEVATVPGTDGRKMSKSYANTIPIFASDEEMREAVMGIATDSKGVDEPKDPDGSTLYAIHKLLLDDAGGQKLRASYTEGGMGYKDLKEALIEDLLAFARPLREKREALAEDTDRVKEILQQGAAKARDRARKKMEEVRKRIGVGRY